MVDRILCCSIKQHHVGYLLSVFLTVLGEFLRQRCCFQDLTPNYHIITIMTMTPITGPPPLPHIGIDSNNNYHTMLKCITYLFRLSEVYISSLMDTSLVRKDKDVNIMKDYPSLQVDTNYIIKEHCFYCISSVPKGSV